MKRLYQFIILIIILFANQTKAQITTHPMLHIGYVYQNQNFGEVGGRLLFLSNDDVLYRMGASALMGSTDSKFVIMPKVQGDILFNFEKNVDFYHSYYFLVGAEATNKYIAPKAGLSLFGIMDITAGYAFSINQKGIYDKELKGFNLNFTFNIPLVMVR